MITHDYTKSKYPCRFYNKYLMRLFEILEKKELALNTSIFNFGSMRDKQILNIVLGRTVSEQDMENAYMKGYKTSKIEGKVYPALIQDNVSITEGTLVHNLSPKDLDRIQYYEAGLFGTEVLPVYTKRGDELKYTQVYTKHSSKVKVLDEEWNFDEYQKNIKPYVKEIKEWMEGYND